MVRDANEIATRFVKDVNRIDPDIRFNWKIVLNTTPALIYYENKTVNLPLWSQLMPELQGFFFDVSGSESDGKKVFGLFFNGFYLPHELGHGLQDTKEGQLAPSYSNEYFANTVAILWLRKQGREKELKECYDYATKMIGRLSNPVPKGMSMEQFFSDNYIKAIQDPNTYGFMQFTQFMEIFNDKDLPDFDRFIRNYLKGK